MKKTNPVPWILLGMLGVYVTFFSYPKKYDGQGKELIPSYQAVQPLVEEKKDPVILEPVSGVKVLRFWDHDEWRYVPATTPDPTLNLIRSLTSSLTGR